MNVSMNGLVGVGLVTIGFVICVITFYWFTRSKGRSPAQVWRESHFFRFVVMLSFLVGVSFICIWMLYNVLLEPALGSMVIALGLGIYFIIHAVYSFIAYVWRLTDVSLPTPGTYLEEVVKQTKGHLKELEDYDE